MKAILAVNNLSFIGLNDALPWRNLEDFKHFKRLTMDKEVLVGYNTLQTLPELKGRIIIEDLRYEFILTHDEIWCIGGKKTYEKYAPYFTELHISHIDDNAIGDTTFPDFSELNPDCKIFNYHF
tara:strand:+ start:19332 stop:19703 length:372 start_codon:yes stop_codon:yes gene_type:complete